MKSQRQPKKKPKPFFFIFFIVEFRKGCAIYRFPRFVGMVEWKKMNKKGVLGLWFGFGFGFGLGLGLGLVLVSMPDFRLLGGSICAVQREPLSRKFPPPIPIGAVAGSGSFGLPFGTRTPVCPGEAPSSAGKFSAPLKFASFVANGRFLWLLASPYFWKSTRVRVRARDRRIKGSKDFY